MVYKVLKRLVGDGILLSPTNPDWKHRRTALAPAFYKGKLAQMVGLARLMVQETI